MTQRTLCVMLVAVMGMFAKQAPAQGMKGRWAVGLGLGTQQLYPDGIVKSTGFGFGGDGSLTYRLSERTGLTITAGYNQLPFTLGLGGLGDVDFSANLFFGDLKFHLELLKGGVRPYVTAGAGMFNFVVTSGNAKSDRFFDGAFIGGGGVRVAIGQKATFDLGANYKYTTGDDLDSGIRGGANDGFLTVRGGVSFALGEPTAEEGTIAEEQAPVESVESPDIDAFRSRLETMEGGQKSEPDMEEYVRMKSKVDELNQQIDSKESEISTLRQAIEQKKGTIGEMEAALETPPAGTIVVESFSQAYEEALNRFHGKRYNEAIQGFTALLAQFPTHSLASNCQYWIGECYFGMGEYGRAVEAFDLVLSYQRSLKQDDALLMLGRAYLKLGQTENARLSLNRLIKEFPASEFVTKAEQLLSKI